MLHKFYEVDSKLGMPNPTQVEKRFSNIVVNDELYKISDSIDLIAKLNQIDGYQYVFEDPVTRETQTFKPDCYLLINSIN